MLDAFGEVSCDAGNREKESHVSTSFIGSTVATQTNFPILIVYNRTLKYASPLLQAFSQDILYCNGFLHFELLGYRFVYYR